MYWIAVIVFLSLAGCDLPTFKQISEQTDDLKSLKLRVADLEQHTAALEEQNLLRPQQPTENWILWQVNEAFNGGSPQALSAYASKPECQAGAGTWNFTNSKVVAQDPIIFQLKGYRVRLECLPAGTNPYGH